MEVNQFSYAVYYCFLRYLYTDEVDLPVDEALGMSPFTNCPVSTRKRERESIHFDFFHTVRFTLSPFIGLLDLANAYCETELKARCQQLIRQSVTVENVATLFAIGLKYEAQVIKLERSLGEAEGSVIE